MTPSSTREVSPAGVPVARRRAVLFAILGVFAVLLVAPPRAAAQTAPTQPPPTTPTVPTAPPTTTPGGVAPTPLPPSPALPDPTPKVHALLAILQAMDIDKLLPAAAQSVADRQVTAQQVADQVAAAQKKVTAANQEVSASEDRLSNLAVTAYVQPDAQTVDVLVNSDTTEAGRRTVLLEVALASEQDRLAQAKAAVKAAEQNVAQVQQAAQSAASDVSAAQAAVQQLQQQSAALRAEAAAALASPTDPWQLTIEGESEFTAPEMAAWFATRNVASKANAPMDQLTQFYVDEGHDEGIRGDMAFAQSVIETGSFTNPDTVNFNNFSGIGHCDTCASGFSFTSPQLGVRAQIQLLKSYAEVFPSYVHPLVDARLKGPAGCCPTWNRLTRVWATDPNYGPVILGVYQKMLEWLVVERGGQIPAGA